MLKVTDISGQTRYIFADKISSVTEAGASSQWHGIRSIVRLTDGKVIECQETAEEIARRAAPAPVQQPLSDEQIVTAIEAAGHNLAYRSYEHDIEAARAVEAAHGITGSKE